jgi:hypothetical protein
MGFSPTSSIRVEMFPEGGHALFNAWPLKSRSSVNQSEESMTRNVKTVKTAPGGGMEHFGRYQMI